MAAWDRSSFSTRSCMYLPAEDAAITSSRCERPRPGRRRRGKSHHLNQLHKHSSSSGSYLRFCVLFSVLLSLSLFPGCAAATPGARRRSASARLAIKEELLFDRSEPPVPPICLIRRQASDNAPSSTSSVPLSTILAPSQTTATTSVASTASTTSLSVESTIASSSPLPQPFDTNLGNNFTNPNCPIFFSRFLANETFQSCLPLSLLLQVRLGQRDITHSRTNSFRHPTPSSPPKSLSSASHKPLTQPALLTSGPATLSWAP